MTAKARFGSSSNRERIKAMVSGVIVVRKGTRDIESRPFISSNTDRYHKQCRITAEPGGVVDATPCRTKNCEERFHKPGYNRESRQDIFEDFPETRIIGVTIALSVGCLPDKNGHHSLTTTCMLQRTLYRVFPTSNSHEIVLHKCYQFLKAFSQANSP